MGTRIIKTVLALAALGVLALAFLFLIASLGRGKALPSAALQPTPVPVATPTAVATPTPPLSPLRSENITITKELQLTTDNVSTFSSWSPASDRVLVSKSTAAKVIAGRNTYYLNDAWVVAADTGEAKKLASNSSGAIWSPDGSKIAFRAIISESQNDIYTLNNDGTGQLKLESADFAPIGWLPDGRIIYVKNHRIWDMDRVGQNKRQINAVREVDYSRTKGFVVSPDGRKIAYADGSRLTIGPLESGDGVRITERLSYDARPRFDVAWSPDSKRIAYATAGPMPELWVVNADGSSPIRLLSGISEFFGQLSWFPQGDVILLGRVPTGTDKQNRARIYTINTDGSGLNDLGGPSLSYTFAALSPEGTKIIFQRDGKVWLALLKALR